jgi:hypothetical protein
MPCTHRPCQDKPCYVRVAGAVSRQGDASRHAKIRALHWKHSMDIERINAIGAKLADLTERTQALRGYL